MTTTLLLCVTAVSVIAVIILSIALYIKTHQSEPSGEINEASIKEILEKNGCIVESSEIHEESLVTIFEYQSLTYILFVNEPFCRLHINVSMPLDEYNPDIITEICNNDMSNINSGHIRYHAEKSLLAITTFSIQKSYEHLNMSLIDMIGCIHEIYGIFNDHYESRKDIE